MLLEFAPTGLGFTRYNADDAWEYVRQVADESGAISRVRTITAAPRNTYEPFTNNCEHFVSHVEFGERSSPQVRSAVAVLIAFVAMLTIAREANRAA